MSNQIMISYRREDTAGITGRIYDRLVAAFGEENVFKDVDSIPLSANFKAYLQDVVSQCAVMLVVIGDRWLGNGGENRLQDARDFVRMEVEAALQRDIPIIPLLVEGGKLPTEADLPPSMAELLFRNGTLIHNDPHFASDMARLIAHLKPIVDPPAPRRTRAKPAPRSQAAGATVEKPRTTRVEEKPASPVSTIARPTAPAPAPAPTTKIAPAPVPANDADQKPEEDDLPSGWLGTVFVAVLGGFIVWWVGEFLLAVASEIFGWNIQESSTRRLVVWSGVTLLYLWWIPRERRRRRGR